MTPEREAHWRQYVEAEVRTHHPWLTKPCTELLGEIDRLRALNDKLLPVVRKAAGRLHPQGCHINPCTCGVTEARAIIAELDGKT